MSGQTLSLWFYPNPTGDRGRDRNARTLQFTCLILSIALAIAVAFNLVSREPVSAQPVGAVFAALCVAAALNRAGKVTWAGRIVTLALLLCAVLRVVHAGDGFRSLAMFMFPGILLLSVMLLDRVSYLATAGLVMLTVAMVGVAEKQGLFGTIPPVRTPVNYESIFLVELTLLAFSVVGSRIVRDAQRNVADLRVSNRELSSANAELRKTAEALYENEQRLFSIYNTVRDVVFYLAVEPGGRFSFVSVNAAFLNVTGLSEEAVVGKTVNEVIPKPSLALALTNYRKAIQEKATVTWEETSDYPAGRLTGEVTIAPVLDDKGMCTYLVGSVHDITERKRAEAAVRESEVRYREVFDHFSECIFVLDVTLEGRFRIAGFNPAEERATGLSNAEVVGKFIDDVLSPETAARAIPHYRQCLELATVIHYDEELNLPSGTKSFHSSLIPLRSETGRIYRIVGCCLDFTELKRSQEEALARQKLESVGTLAGGIAHDFNNLLGAVLAQADVALAEYASGAAPTAPLITIQDLAIRGSEIVRQLMIYAGNESAVPELVNISRVVEEMLGLLRVSLSKHAKLQTDLGERLQPVRCRSAQFRQIVMNLIMNASEAIGDRDGVIRLTTRAVAVGPGGIFNGMSEGDYVELAVSDTGIGMPVGIQARVFDPFFTTKSAGRGLGLSVVHGIVRSIGGAIHIASESGNGATVQILLPCAEAGSTVTVKSSSLPAMEALSSKKCGVLVVEDEESLRQAVVMKLRREGFEVYQAPNGSVAIEQLHAAGEEIALMLLDMTIPGAAVSEVVATAATVRPDIKVIATSAYSHEMLTGDLSALQIRTFIRKPFRLADLVKILRDCLLS